METSSVVMIKSLTEQTQQIMSMLMCPSTQTILVNRRFHFSFSKHYVSFSQDMSHGESIP